MCEWGAIRDERDADAVAGGGTALCGTGPEDVEAFADILGKMSVENKNERNESVHKKGSLIE